MNYFYTAQLHWKPSKYPQLHMTLISATKFADTPDTSGLGTVLVGMSVTGENNNQQFSSYEWWCTTLDITVPKFILTFSQLPC